MGFEDIITIGTVENFPDIREDKITIRYEEEGGNTFMSNERNLVTAGGNLGIRGIPIYSITTAWLNRPDVTQELLERVKRIEDILSNISDANRREMEEHEKWKEAFDAQLDVMDRGLDELEKLASEFGNLKKK